ncbi:hypothetical protein [Capnocytophaga catalasegens]|uniref:Membrane-binding protein n=1 Tax=Capnocytophaga catalasegens TaxID=1004260 RepID=A0AAV5AWA1_9FLAO|nr:hypothetical protein [Capnocytophaga catalasegens]GIZ16376.1 hypothetical protein RCZ03_23760 [Capnocytophaga catalasegens]GJM51567.1 hypothetical protein RCZ15_25400 [Capnocytophaga catalasegens]GJM54305.1 hypothetical protein RCZ16_26210 [Capnocytophaga catalasegens]
MATGLKNQATEVAKSGIDSDFIQKLESTRTDAIALNDEQERLKAELKSKTEQLDSTMKELGAMLSEAKKVVKLALPQVGWREFGIEDKR